MSIRRMVGHELVALGRHEDLVFAEPRRPRRAAAHLDNLGEVEGALDVKRPVASDCGAPHLDAPKAPHEEPLARA